MAREAIRPARQLQSPVRKQPRKTWIWVLPVLAVLVGSAVLLGMHRKPAAPAVPDLPLADEADLLAVPADKLHVFRLKPAPNILVFLFPSLTVQGHMLNRVGAFVEKAGVPHDHVLGDAAMSAAIAAGHDTVESFYYGHDYRAADLARFYDTARADGIGLDHEEMDLHGLLDRAHFWSSGAPEAMITLPPAGGDGMDASARATILRHEISHGVYFTDPAYAAYVKHFWSDVMTEDQRARIRAFLGSENYDTTNEDLMRNEMQAYLVHTSDSRFFNAAAAHMTTAECAALRATFVQGMPPSWLRDRTAP